MLRHHNASYSFAQLFVDNYGDGCYHCAYAHPDLSSNINESNHGTELLSSELSVQHRASMPISIQT